MTTTALEYTKDFLPHDMATLVTDAFNRWKQGRIVNETTWTEVRNYVFATDTTTTSNSKLPWKNKTTRPKLCQIRDNLHANYMSALFPNDNWFKWQASSKAGLNKDTALAIESYMMHKFNESKFKDTVSRLVLDFIDYGNVFAEVEYTNETYTDKLGLPQSVYTGPRLVRISPLDITFDITATSFLQTPKITRKLLTLGQIEKLRKTDPDWAIVAKETINQIRANRQLILAAPQSFSKSDQQKLNGFIADGFNTLIDYYRSGLVEFLEFEGDLYDAKRDILYENHVVTIVDRLYVVRNEPISNWSGRSYKQHCGWRLRPDNLMAMGPLANLVGLQYRLDHLENLRADVFDLIATPPLKIKGYVEDFRWGPNERIYMEQDADVESLAPETIALNADMQIGQIEQTMELMAGAPKEAMGIRSPGEKTAFEVGQLETAASRMFQNKISYFEETFLEPLMNGMLEIARRNMMDPEIVRVVESELGVQAFMSITREDLQAKGTLTPMGARHFAAQNALVQNLTNLSQTGMWQDPAVRVHFSGKAIAELIEENLNLEKFGIFSPYIGIAESLEAQQMQQQAQEEAGVHAMTPTLTQGDVDASGQAPPDQAQQGQPVDG